MVFGSVVTVFGRILDISHLRSLTMAAPAKTMETYVLVRPMPRVGATSREEIKALAQKSNDAIRMCHEEHADHHIKWVQTFLTDDASYCVYKASSPEVLQARARRTRCDAGAGSRGARQAPAAAGARVRERARGMLAWSVASRVAAASAARQLYATHAGARCDVKSCITLSLIRELPAR
jgi:hypothetical protein